MIFSVFYEDKWIHCHIKLMNANIERALFYFYVTEAMLIDTKTNNFFDEG